MYEKYYGFTTKPFDLLPDPQFLYLSEKHDVALAHLEYGITDNKGFIVLTGDVGAGKTTLANFFLRKVDIKVNTALIYNTNLDPTTFLEMIVKDFGLQAPDTRRSTLYDTLYQFLLSEHMGGKRSVLIIDEAQNMPNQTLEEVRMLSNFETEESYLLQIILIGQPQLRKRLNDPELSQLTQRVSVYYHLAPLDKPEVSQYIRHRLKVSGRSTHDPLFTEKAIERIYAYSGGIPRLISSICDTALLYGYTDDVKTIDLGIIERVIRNRGIQAGLCAEDSSGEIPGYPDATGQKSATLSVGATQLKKRLASIEQRLESLESKDNHDVIVQLMKSLNNLHRENAVLRKRYYATLNKDKDNETSSKDKPDTRAQKLSPINLGKKS